MISGQSTWQRLSAYNESAKVIEGYYATTGFILDDGGRRLLRVCAVQSGRVLATVAATGRAFGPTHHLK